MDYNLNTTNRIRIRRHMIHHIIHDRHCDFCGSRDHYIRRCNDTRILDFKHLCISTMLTHTDQDFKNWLINYQNDYGEVVKAFALSRCNWTTSDNLHSMLDKIIMYIKEEITPPDLIRIESGSNTNYREILSNISVGLSNILRKEIIQTSSTENERLLRLGLNNHLINQLNIIPIFKIDSDAENKCDCAICLEDDLREKEFVTLNCSHKFCKNCFNNHLSHAHLSQSKCALCRETILSIIIYEDSK